ncbi:MAG: sulfite exporter TauE/SafE family protein [Kiloniellales bacterium]|nr:sulfite exporter TauE/SafE family protein [Kiloniellales bacterium]
MEMTAFALHAAVLGAALIQAATGIGFGVIAGPVILLTLNSGVAVQVTILLSLLIAVILAPSLYRQVDWRFLRRLLIGSLFGLPLGLLVFVLIDVDWLKLLAGIAVLLMAVSASGLMAARRSDGEAPARRWGDLGVGLVSGAMSSSLAMPGPVAAARMSALDQSKQCIRATILVLFVFSYGAAIALQASLIEVSGETLSLAATLAPATLVGLLLGRWALAWISEAMFRRLLLLVLVATSASLLFNAIQGLIDRA